MKKTYKSAHGATIDFQSLILKNEDVRAVGNMNVNARGDVISPENKKVASRSEQVNKQYRKQHSNRVRDIPVASSKRNAKETAEKVAQAIANSTVAEPITGLDEIVNEIAEEAQVSTEAELEQAEKGGLASAIAKVKEVKQQPQPSPREEERGGDGVKKI